MTWARLDDLLPVHPKVRALNDAAFRLYICAICWSNQHLTDGHVPRDQLRYLSDVRRPVQCAEMLVTAGLWELNGDGWKIHDYLEYQPSADKVRQEREAKRQRQERWKANRDASRNASKDASGDAPPIPIPSHPIPSNTSVVTSPADRRADPPDVIIIRAVQGAISDRTGRTISDDAARAAATQIIGKESVRNPAAYIAAAIMRDPNPRRFLPVTVPPPLPKRQKRDDQDEINARGRERARAALAAVKPDQVAVPEPPAERLPIEDQAWHAAAGTRREGTP